MLNYTIIQPLDDGKDVKENFAIVSAESSAQLKFVADASIAVTFNWMN